MDDLIARLVRRARDRRRAADMRPGPVSFAQGRMIAGPFAVQPPASAEEVARAEERLGFPLPDLLKRIYLEIGNGGFGPGYGILGVPSPHAFRITRSLRDGRVHVERVEPETIFRLYQELLDAWRDWPYDDDDDGFPPLDWPRHLVPIANGGCGRYSVADCRDREAPILHYDPDSVDDEAQTQAAYYGHVLVAEAPSMAAWLQFWLDLP